MAKVPVFNPKTANTLSRRTPVANVKVTDNSTASAFGGDIAPAMRALGNAGFEFGLELKKKEDAKQKEADLKQERLALAKQEAARKVNVEVKKAAHDANKALDTAMHGKGGALEMTASDAYPMIDLEKQLDEITRKHVSHLPPEARPAALAKVKPVRDMHLAKGGLHYSQQLTALEHQNSNQILQDNYNSLVRYSVRDGRYDPEQTRLQLDNLKHSLTRNGETLGLSQDQIDQKFAGIRSAMFVDITEGLVRNGSLAEARALQQNNLDMISPDDMAHMNTVLDDAELVAATDLLSDEMWGGANDEY